MQFCFVSKSLKIMLNLTQRSLPLVLSVFLCLPIVACNAGILGVDKISQTELIEKIDTKRPLLILDVRSQKEYDEEHIPGAINIEYRELKNQIETIASFKNTPVVVYCERGIRAGIAERTLQNAGFQNILHLEGDMVAWRKNSLPTVKI